MQFFLLLRGVDMGGGGAIAALNTGLVTEAMVCDITGWIDNTGTISGSLGPLVMSATGTSSVPVFTGSADLIMDDMIMASPGFTGTNAGTGSVFDEMIMTAVGSVDDPHDGVLIRPFEIMLMAATGVITPPADVLANVALHPAAMIMVATGTISPVVDQPEIIFDPKTQKGHLAP